MDTNNTLVVGYDGSDDADLALRTGVEMAALHGWSLEVLIADGDLGHSVWGEEWCRELGREWAARAAKVLADLGRPDVPIDARDGLASPLLIDASRHARLLVVGARGHGLVATMLWGSVSQHVARHAHCPTLVARPTPRDARGVVVGFDGSAPSQRALEFALEHARLRGVPLDVVHVPEHLSSWAYDVALPAVALVELRAFDEQTAAEASRIASGWPDVETTVRVVEGRPAVELLKASQAAELIVVGSRGAGAFRELLLGSAASAVLRLAHTNVAVVR